MNTKWLVWILFLLLVPVDTALAGLDQRINEMLEDGQRVSLYRDATMGNAVISIGFAQHSSENVAISMAQQEALKHLTAFLHGQRVSATDYAHQKYIGDQVEEELFQQMMSQVAATVEAAYFYRSGVHGHQSYGVMIVSEQGLQSAALFKREKGLNIVEARGFASLKDGIAKARTDALSQALRNAVEQYAGVQIAAKTSIEDADIYRAKLSTVSQGHVKRYEIRRESSEGARYIIEIVAEISEEEVEATIDAIRESLGRPTFFLKIADARLNKMVMNILTQNGMEISSSEQAASYLVLGEADQFEYDIRMAPDMKGLQTTIHLKVFEKSSGDYIITLSNDPSASVEISATREIRERNSYSYALTEIEQQFIRDINQKFTHRFQSGTKAVVKLMRFDRMRDVDELRACIEALPMTRSVSVSPVADKTVTFEVVYLGNPSDLQLEILKKSRDFRLRGLRARSNDQGEIWLTF